jgi:hypothetical protein
MFLAALLGGLVACAESSVRDDAASESASQVSCNDDGARPLPLSRFIARDRCFLPAEEIEGVCAGPSDGGRPDGHFVCVTYPGSVSYAAYLQPAEGIGGGVRHFSYLEIDSIPMADPRANCEALFDTLIEMDESGGHVVIGMIRGNAAVVGPPCAQ